MPEKVLVNACLRRAARKERLGLSLDANGLVYFYSLQPDTNGQVVQIEEGDHLLLDQIPADLDCLYGLDGVENVYVKGMNFIFRDHSGRQHSKKCFADCGVEVIMVDHAGAGYVTVGSGVERKLKYSDPVEININDQFGATLEGC